MDRVFMSKKTDYADYLKQTLSDAVKKSYPVFQNEVIEIMAGRLKEACAVLKKECGFDMLLDIVAVDWKGHPKESQFSNRFELNYFFFNMKKNERVQLKVAVPHDQNPEVDSIVEICSIADWMERECYDMMGIRFQGHPNLKRLLMWENFEGHPLRKDYPIQKRQPIPVLDDVVT